jgi:hypothetical protein
LPICENSACHTWKGTKHFTDAHMLHKWPRKHFLNCAYKGSNKWTINLKMQRQEYWGVLRN